MLVFSSWHAVHNVACNTAKKITYHFNFIALELIYDLLLTYKAFVNVLFNCYYFLYC